MARDERLLDDASTDPARTTEHRKPHSSILPKGTILRSRAWASVGSVGGLVLALPDAVMARPTGVGRAGTHAEFRQILIEGADQRGMAAAKGNFRASR